LAGKAVEKLRGFDDRPEILPGMILGENGVAAT
jgi:hypothetical protein